MPIGNQSSWAVTRAGLVTVQIGMTVSLVAGAVFAWQLVALNGTLGSAISNPAVMLAPLARSILSALRIAALN